MKSISFMRIIVVFLSLNRSVTFVTRHWNSCCCWELNPTFHVCLLSTSLLSLKAFFLTQFGWSTAQNTTPADEVGLRGQVEATGSVDEILKKFSHLVLLRRQPSFIGENKRDSVTWLITWPLLLLLLWLLLRNISLVNKWLGSEWKRSLRNKMSFNVFKILINPWKTFLCLFHVK